MDSAASVNGENLNGVSAESLPRYGFMAILLNFPLISAFFSFSIAQILKLFTTCFVPYREVNGFQSERRKVDRVESNSITPSNSTSGQKEKRWDFKRLVGSGGMPSSHSATVMGLAVSVGFHEGLSSSLFAACLVLAAVVMYDASGVRLQAGRQAEVLNQIVYELPPEHPLADSRPLREPLGHTPPQVIAGAILGFLVASLLFLISPPTIKHSKP